MLDILNLDRLITPGLTRWDMWIFLQLSKHITWGSRSHVTAKELAVELRTTSQQIRQSVSRLRKKRLLHFDSGNRYKWTLDPSVVWKGPAHGRREAKLMFDALFPPAEVVVFSREKTHVALG